MEKGLLIALAILVIFALVGKGGAAGTRAGFDCPRDPTRNEWDESLFSCSKENPRNAERAAACTRTRACTRARTRPTLAKSSSNPESFEPLFA